MNILRLTICLSMLLSILPMSGWYYDPDGVENPLDSDFTENVRYVTYECRNAKLAEINWKDELEWESSTVYMTAVYCEDGTVYLKNFLNLITIYSASQSCRKYWIKGKLSEDGQYINIPVGQMATTHSYTNARYFQPAILTTLENQSTIIVDDSTNGISLHIEDDGSLSPLGIDDTHGWCCMNYLDNEINQILFCGTLVPTEEQPMLPPPGLKKEDYEFKFITPGGRAGFGDLGKRVKAVFLNDSIFIQGCSYLCNEGWSIGRKEGDTYVFEIEKQPVKNVCLNAVDSEITDARYHYYTTYSPIDSDVIFDIDQKSNSLVARSTFWTYGPSGKIMFDSELRGTYMDNDIYISAVFNKIPYGPQHPLSPEVTIEDESNGTSKVTVCGSYFDSDGYVMDTRKLFYRLYVDGIPYTFTKVEKWFSFDLADATELLPYYLLNVSRDQKDTPSQYDFYVTIPSTFREVMAELVYIQDGQEISSSVKSVNDNSSFYNDSDDVFDLTGRKVSPNTLSPGIYIKGGQKFAVK